MAERYSNRDVAVFSIDNNAYLGTLKNATFSVDVENVDARGIADDYKYPWATGRAAKFEATVMRGAAASLLAVAVSGAAQVQYAVDFGGEAYSGTALMTAASLKADMGALQEYSVTLECQGAPQVSA